MVLFVETVGVVGAGTMGARIAEIFALNGKQVLLTDVKEEYVAKGLASIRTSLEGLAAFHEGKAEREIRQAEGALGIRLAPDQMETARKKIRPTYTRARVEEARTRVRGTTSLDELAPADLVIEAVVEDARIKSEVFGRLSSLTDRRCILATNTSSLSITQLAEASGRPARFLGLHFFNPPTTLPLVEVIPGRGTEPETVDDAVNLLAGLRNHRYPLLPILVKECPGFLVNRILGAMLREAYACLEEGIASARDIDTAMKAGAGLPMGPLELSDLIGLDVIQHASRVIESQTGVYPFVTKPTVLERLVKEGRLGKKTGRGFFEYSA